MFTLILILILPGAFLPLALKSSFSSEELMEMGVYLEDNETTPIAHPESSNRSHSGHPRLRTRLSTRA